MSVNIPSQVKLDIMQMIKSKDVKLLACGDAEGWVNLSAIRITVIDIKKGTVTIQLSTEFKGKEFEILQEAVLCKGNTYILYMDDSFKAKRKFVLR